MKASKALFPLLFALVITLWIASATILFHIFGVPDSPGGAGDAFGAINALFSGLAMAGVIYAIILQRQELELQRDEQTNSRRELSEQNQLIADQLATMRESLNLEQTRATIEALPRLRLKGSISGNRTSRIFKLTNVGGPMSNVTVHATEGCTVTIKPSEALQTSEDLEVDLQRMSSVEFPRSVIVTFHYTDKLGKEGTLRYKVSVDSQGATLVEQHAGGYPASPA